jgi:hypothetical protein
MSIVQRLLNRFRRKPPIIDTTWGPVSESARAQAETNLRLDPALRMRVLEVITREMGGDIEVGMREARRRYPQGGF